MTDEGLRMDKCSSLPMWAYFWEGQGYTDPRNIIFLALGFWIDSTFFHGIVLTFL